MSSSSAGFQAKTPIPRVSHLYIEREALAFEDCDRVLALYPSARRIYIEDYKEIFNRPRQSFRLQKNDPKLILAKKRGGFLYRGSERIDSFAENPVSYNALIRNCLFDCDYCFLQGMHESANIVVYVNNDEFQNAAVDALANGPLYLSISYLTDLLGFEGLLPFCRRWIDLARLHPSLTIEIRTKSDNYHAIRDIDPISNVVLCWTVTPAAFAARYERGTASFQNRVFAVRAAIGDGWRVRLCFDPVIRGPDWEHAYRECIDELSRRLDLGRVDRFSIGTMRMPAPFLNRMRADHADGTRTAESEILYQGYEIGNGNAALSEEDDATTKATLAHELARHVDRRRIAFAGR